MNGLMTDWPLTLPHFLDRARRLHHRRVLASPHAGETFRYRLWRRAPSRRDLHEIRSVGDRIEAPCVSEHQKSVSRQGGPGRGPYIVLREYPGRLQAAVCGSAGTVDSTKLDSTKSATASPTMT